MICLHILQLLAAVAAVDARIGNGRNPGDGKTERALEKDSMFRDDEGKLHWWTYVFVLIVFVVVGTVGSVIYCFCFMKRSSADEGQLSSRSKPHELEQTQKSSSSSTDGSFNNIGTNDQPLRELEQPQASKKTSKKNRSSHSQSEGDFDARASMKKSKKNRSPRNHSEDGLGKKDRSSRNHSEEGVELEKSMKKSNKNDRSGSMKKCSKKDRSRSSKSESRDLEPEGSSSQNMDFADDDEEERARLKAIRKQKRREQKRRLKEQEMEDEKARQKAIRKAERKEAKRRASLEE